MNPTTMLFLAIFSAVAGQLLMKVGMNQVGAINSVSVSAFLHMIFNPFVFVGIGSYGIGFIFYLFSLSKLPQSFAYPMFALGYVVVPVFNWLVWHEAFPITRLAGVVIILLGVWLVSR
jgi:multidrug transporter EmrE-like cation transporter